ncbi:segregation and condensation protein A [Risungbinella massiliensis]|uniref:segregation and condensation protein A n=1 Tax=Risungbinella massiliensis TaxID=1329796 RepID=UPI0005CC60B6|nr:segregation/condensation protein A [Risungbinella massiliensis]
MELQIKLDKFEGPLDLLLHLIDQAEVDIYQISISEITDQYMKVISEAQELRLEIASEFLVMAATLLAMKSRMLLPRTQTKEEESEEWQEEWADPREELIDRLLEYKRYKRLGEVLRAKEEERSQIFTRMPADLTSFAPPTNPLKGITPDDLFQVFIQALQDQPEEEPDEPFTNMQREEISVSARMEEIYQDLVEKGELTFEYLLSTFRLTKERIIVTFLALLELMKLKKIRCIQRDLFQDIIIEPFIEEGTLGES